MGESSVRWAATFPAQQAPEPAIPRPGQSLLDRIGNTPLLRFDQLTLDLPGVTLLGKAEWHNPGGSVKDRAAANIVAEGRLSGKLSPGKTLLDATSGNTGIAYAMLGAAEGFPVTLCMPQNVSDERKKILNAYGANIHPGRARPCHQTSGFVFLRRSILERRQLDGPLSRNG
jgi:cysteine synthase